MLDLNMISAVNKRRASEYSSSLLFTFDSIVDIDLNMIIFLKETYKDSAYLDRDLIINDDMNFFRALLANREDKNPIKLVLADACKDSAANIYYELLEDHYEKILSYGTELLSFGILFCNAINANKAFKTTVLCKNELEVQYIKKLSPNANTVLESALTNLNNYTSIYMKYFDFCLNYLPLKGKNLYILNYPFNLEKGEPGVLRLDIFEKLSEANKYGLSNPYKDFIQPV